MKSFLFILSALLAAPFWARSEQVWVASRAFAIDKVFTSMQGPVQNRSAFNPLDKNEQGWITGMRVELIEERRDVSEQDMFCHANLWRAPQGAKANERLLTLIPGRTGIRFPEGYGLRISGQDPLDLYQQALNLDAKRSPTAVRFKTTIDYERKPQKDLEMRTAVIVLPLKDYQRPEEICAAPNIRDTIRSACIPSMTASDDMMKNTNELVTMHWMVPPGRHFYRTTANDQLRLKGKPVVHYATAHLHPYGDSLKLVEKASGKEVFKFAGSLDDKKLGVGHIEDWSSANGEQLDGNKEYELVAEYNNPTGKPIDAMAIVYLYTAKASGRN